MCDYVIWDSDKVGYHNLEDLLLPQWRLWILGWRYSREPGSPEQNFISLVFFILFSLWLVMHVASQFDQYKCVILLSRSARTSCNTSGGPVRKKNLDHLYTGIYDLRIIRRLIKPTWWPHGIPKKPLGPPNNPLNLMGDPWWIPLRSSRLPTNHRGPIKCRCWSYGIP